MNSVGHRKKTTLVLLVVLLLGLLGFVIWDAMFRARPQPPWIGADRRSEFLYGSIHEEQQAGIPYWIWLALPRLFPEYLPGPGGYASLGFPWEETREMPAGFSKQTVGYVRVAGNCAICHAASQSKGPDEAPTVVAGGSGHTAELLRLQHFYQQCAGDPRFTANDLLDEIGMATRLSLADRLLYRFLLIPRARKQLLQSQFVMIDRDLWEHSQHPQADPDLRRKLQEVNLEAETKKVPVKGTY